MKYFYSKTLILCKGSHNNCMTNIPSSQKFTYLKMNWYASASFYLFIESNQIFLSKHFKEKIKKKKNKAAVQGKKLVSLQMKFNLEEIFAKIISLTMISEKYTALDAPWFWCIFEAFNLTEELLKSNLLTRFTFLQVMKTFHYFNMSIQTGSLSNHSPQIQ